MRGQLRIAMLVPDNRDEFRQYERPEPVFGPAPEALLMGLATLPEVEVHIVACTQRPLAAPERIAPNVFYHSLVVPKIGWLRTGYQGCLRAIRRKLRELQPDLVHGQGTERYCALSAVLSGHPNVITIHGNMRNIARINRARPFSFLWWSACLERLTLPRAGGVVCITRHTQQLVRDLARRTWVLPNAVDAGFFTLERQPEKLPVVLCVANICHHKNQNFLIRSLDPLARELQFTLRFLGKLDQADPYSREFQTLIHDRAWCQHAGFVDRERLQQELARAALVVLPSLEENCPMAVLEAAAAGVPVAAARVGGVPDLVDEGRTGELFDPQNSAEIFAVVRRLLTSPREASKLAETAKRESVRRFHPHEVALKHVAIYRELLAAPQS
jgi:glycosyltransferase involved in cell wall biosynthesis